MRSSERGNALFLILIAVALFAVLSYAVTQSGRGRGGIDKETTLLKTTQLLSFVSSIESRIQRMLLIDRINPLDLSFSATGIYTLGPVATTTPDCWLSNANCTTDSCQVFDAVDGIPALTFDASFIVDGAGIAGRPTPGHLSKKQYVISGIGTDDPDLAIVIPYLKPEICNTINKRHGITTNYDGTEYFTGLGEEITAIGANFGGCATPAVWSTTRTPFGDQATAFTGKTTFCMPFDSASPGLALVHVLITR